MSYLNSILFLFPPQNYYKNCTYATFLHFFCQILVRSKYLLYSCGSKIGNNTLFAAQYILFLAENEPIEVWIHIERYYNSGILHAFKHIFMNQYEFAVREYF